MSFPLRTYICRYTCTCIHISNACLHVRTHLHAHTPASAYVQVCARMQTRVAYVYKFTSDIPSSLVHKHMHTSPHTSTSCTHLLPPPLTHIHSLPLSHSDFNPPSNPPYSPNLVLRSVHFFPSTCDSDTNSPISENTFYHSIISENTFYHSIISENTFYHSIISENTFYHIREHILPFLPLHV